MILGVHHVSLSTRDRQPLLKFYRELLGFQTLLEFEWQPGTDIGAKGDRIVGLKNTSVQITILQAGNCCIEIFEYRHPIGAENPNRPACDSGIAHICVDVVDVDNEYERLKAAGVPFHCPPQDMAGIAKTTYGRDPDGNIVEFQEILDSTHPILYESLARLRAGANRGR